MPPCPPAGPPGEERLNHRGPGTLPGPQQLSPRRWLPGSRGRMALPTLLGARRSQRSPTRPTIPGQPPTPEVGLSHLHLTREALQPTSKQHGCPGGRVLSGGTMRHRVGAPSWGRPGWHRVAAVTGHSLAPWAAPCCNLGTVGRHPPFLLQAWGAAAHHPCSRAGRGRGAGLSATLSAQGSWRAGALGSQRVFLRPRPQPGVSRPESGACQGPKASHGGGSP